MSLLPPLAARLVGFVVLVLSGLLVRSAEAAMKRAGTNVRPDLPTLSIVTDGPFRFTRNPVYLATTGLYLGVTLLVNTPWPLALLPPMLLVLHGGVIRREERYLEKKLGSPTACTEPGYAAGGKLPRDAAQPAHAADEPEVSRARPARSVPRGRRGK